MSDCRVIAHSRSYDHLFAVCTSSYVKAPHLQLKGNFKLKSNNKLDYIDKLRFEYSSVVNFTTKGLIDEKINVKSLTLKFQAEIPYGDLTNFSVFSYLGHISSTKFPET